MPLQNSSREIVISAKDGSSIHEALFKRYGLDVKVHHTMQMGYRNHNYPAQLRDGSMVNLIIYKAEDGMRRTIISSHYVADRLHANGFPARCLYDARIVQIGASKPERLAAVYQYLPGETIAWEAYTREHIKTLGKTMATMHELLAGQPQAHLPRADTRFIQLTHRMNLYFSDSGVQAAMQSKLGLTLAVKNLWDLYVQLFQWLTTQVAQPLHLDFVRGNILFTPGTSTVSGVLDFEKAAYGTVLYDIARTTAFLLVDCKYKPASKVRKYFLHSGYVKRGHGTITNIRMPVNTNLVPVLPLLINFFLLHDFYKFLRHNPYDSLELNEHFRRTRELLLEQKILRYSIAD